MLEVLVEPDVDRLYFWALQVGFHDGSSGRGAAHTGLQWHGRGSEQRAVNWGGYRDGAEGGGELTGSVSDLARLDANGNTVRYPWRARQPYRFRVSRTSAGWRAEITGLAAGQTTVIRDLLAPGPYLADPVVWSEVFAPCDDPPVKVRWSGLEAVTDAGRTIRPEAVTVTYQAEDAGGCPNTDVGIDAHGVIQMTNTPRTVAHGATIAVASPPPPTP